MKQSSKRPSHRGLLNAARYCQRVPPRLLRRLSRHGTGGSAPRRPNAPVIPRRERRLPQGTRVARLERSEPRARRRRWRRWAQEPQGRQLPGRVRSSASPRFPTPTPSDTPGRRRPPRAGDAGDLASVVSVPPALLGRGRAAPAAASAPSAPADRARPQRVLTPSPRPPGLLPSSARCVAGARGRPPTTRRPGSLALWLRGRRSDGGTGMPGPGGERGPLCGRRALWASLSACSAAAAGLCAPLAEAAAPPGRLLPWCGSRYSGNVLLSSLGLGWR